MKIKNAFSALSDEAQEDESAGPSAYENPCEISGGPPELTDSDEEENREVVEELSDDEDSQSINEMLTTTLQDGWQVKRSNRRKGFRK